MKQRGNTLVAVVLVIGAIAAVGMFMATTYNGFVRLSQEVDRQYAVLEGSLQRRFDLIPNLVETVKGGMAQEQQVFGAIADARARMAGASRDSAQASASGLAGSPATFVASGATTAIYSAVHAVVLESGLTCVVVHQFLTFFQAKVGLP